MAFDPSTIDETKPAQGTPTTESVRRNTAAIKAALTDHQTTLDDITATRARWVTIWQGNAASADPATFKTHPTIGTYRLTCKDGTAYVLQVASANSTKSAQTTFTTTDDTTTTYTDISNRPTGWAVELVTINVMTGTTTRTAQNITQIAYLA